MAVIEPTTAVERQPLAAVMRAIFLEPAPTYPVRLSSVRALHGVLTATVWQEPHQSHFPNFALLPWGAGCGWAALWVGDRAERVKALPSRHAVNVYSADRTLTLGPPVSPLTPVWTTSDSLLCVDTETPLSITRSMVIGSLSLTNKQARKLGRAVKVAHRAPSTEILQRNLAGSYSLSCVAKEAQAMPLRCEVVLDQTEPTSLHVGPKQGRVHGFRGRLMVLCNPAARYLLECAAMVGLGSRLGFGFGRIQVRHVKGRQS